MKTKLKQTSQGRLEARDGILYVVMETALDGAPPRDCSPAMRQWFRVEEPDADPAVVSGRPVRKVDPREGLFTDEEGNSYRLAGGGQTRPDYAEVVPVGGGRGTQSWKRSSRQCRPGTAAKTEQAGGAAREEKRTIVP